MSQESILYESSSYRGKQTIEDIITQLDTKDYSNTALTVS